jgi:Domain of unknown function (DUF4340)
MKPARLLIAAILLAGLGAALYFSNKSEAAKEKAPSKDKDAAPKILALTEADIRTIDIKKPGSDPTTLKKDDSGKWSITAPKPLPADQSSVGTLTSATTSLNAERVIDDHPSDLSSYGLQPALEDITFTMKDGNKKELLLGDDTPAGGNAYAMISGDPHLYTVSSFNKSSFDKSTKDLRDKRMMTFDQDKISRVELTAKKTSEEFGRINQNEWQILKPKPLRADGFQVDDLVRKLSGANMDPAVSEDDAKKAAAAFASGTPVAIAKVTDATGTQTLEVRKNKDDYYAKSSQVEGIYKVPKDLGEGVDKSLDDFRNKKLFDFGFNDPNKIEFKDGAKDTVLEKSGEKWTSAGKTMDSTAVQAFIDKVRDLAASKFVDAGFTTPQIELTVVSNDGKRTEKVQIAPSGDHFVARRENESTLYQLDANTIKDLREAAEGVKEAPPEPKKK